MHVNFGLVTHQRTSENICKKYFGKCWFRLTCFTKKLRISMLARRRRSAPYTRRVQLGTEWMHRTRRQRVFTRTVFSQAPTCSVCTCWGALDRALRELANWLVGWCTRWTYQVWYRRPHRTGHSERCDSSVWNLTFTGCVQVVSDDCTGCLTASNN